MASKVSGIIWRWFHSTWSKHARFLLSDILWCCSYLFHIEKCIFILYIKKRRALNSFCVYKRVSPDMFDLKIYVFYIFKSILNFGFLLIFFDFFRFFSIFFHIFPTFITFLQSHQQQIKALTLVRIFQIKSTFHKISTKINASTIFPSVTFRIVMEAIEFDVVVLSGALKKQQHFTLSM